VCGFDFIRLNDQINLNQGLQTAAHGPNATRDAILSMTKRIIYLRKIC